MLKTYNSDEYGMPFERALIDKVWKKAYVQPGVDPDELRKDVCGAWISYDRFGKNDDYGWEIDHIMPVSAGGTDDLSNLQPLHHQNNRHKSDNYPEWSCLIEASSSEK